MVTSPGASVTPTQSLESGLYLAPPGFVSLAVVPSAFHKCGQKSWNGLSLDSVTITFALTYTSCGFCEYMKIDAIKRKGTIYVKIQVNITIVETI